jgi:hypothetical protein
MIESVKEQTNQEKLKSINDELSQTCFQYGRACFEIKMRGHERDNLEITFTNQQKHLQKILEEIAKEQRLKKVPEPPSAPDPFTTQGLEGVNQ